MEELLDGIGGQEGPVAYLLLAAAAALEYVFPPFPGDTVTLFGAFLVAARGWNGPAVLAVVLAGSLAGAAVDYSIGVGLAREPRGRNPLSRFWARALDRAGPFVERLRRRGPSFIVVNRFLPGVRAFFFVAAGMARLPIGSVLFYAALSALAWNLLILAAGFALGASWERLRTAGEVYTTVLYALMGLVAAALLARWARRRRRRAVGLDSRGAEDLPRDS